MRSQTDGSPWTARRATRGGGTDVPVTRPERLRAVPLSDLKPMWDAWSDEIERARNAYYQATSGPAHHTLPDGRRDN